MRLLLILAFAVGFGTHLCAQYTLRQVDGDDTVELKLNGDVRLDMRMEGASFTESHRQLRGRVAEPRRGLFQIVWEYEHKEYTLNTGMRKHEDIDYRGIPELTPMAMVQEDIQAVLYRSPKAGQWHKAGQWLTFLGAVNALIVAPLVSADFKNDTFNTDQYLQWAGYSLAAGGIGVTIMLTHGYKTYPVQANYPNRKGRPLWQF